MVVLTAAARAQEQVEVVGTAPDPDDAGARVTSIDPRDLPASADVATAAARAPGVVVRRLGGLGDPAQVGIRGAGGRHTEVWLDAIPLNPEGSEALDVSDLPLPAFERVDVLRGPTPTGAGVPAIGGALWLVSRRGPVGDVALSGGNWGTARAAVVDGGRAGLLAVDGLTTAGDFAWLDDRGTPSTPADDRWVPRENNDARRISTLARAGGGPLAVIHAATLRDEGVPGFSSAPLSAARYGLHRELLGVSGRGEVGTTVVSASGWGLWRAERFTDPAGELGLGPRDERTRSASVGFAPTVSSALSPSLRLETGVHGRWEGVTLPGGDGRDRVVGRVQAGLPWADDRTHVWPTVLLVAVSSADEARAAAALWLPRLAVRRDVGPVALTATGGAAGRPPDLVELFGDRGVQLGNPDLRPERAWGADLGVGGGDALHAELVGFGQWVRDQIVWFPTPRGVAVPRNVERSRVFGLEGSAAAEGEAGGFRLAATLLDARRLDDDPTYDGRRLPRVPAAELSAAAHGRLSRLDAGADAALVSTTYADPANLVPEAPRALLGATVRAVLGDGFSLEADARNLLGARTARVDRDPLVDDGVTVDRALQDFGGYPLPGRQVLLTVRWSGDR